MSRPNLIVNLLVNEPPPPSRPPAPLATRNFFIRSQLVELFFQADVIGDGWPVVFTLPKLQNRAKLVAPRRMEQQHMKCTCDVTPRHVRIFAYRTVGRRDTQ